MGRNVLLRSLMAAFLAAAVGCHAGAPPLQGTNLARASAAATAGFGAVAAAGITVTGRVDFPPARNTLATTADVVNAATVSLIDTGTSTTIASGKTDSSGNFTVSLGTYSPGSQPYILEAVRGLGNNAPGSDAARFRTILMFVGGAWKSCTNATAGSGSIIINSNTTALAIEASLFPAQVSYANTIGKVDITGSPAVFYKPMGFSGHPDTEFDNLSADILNFLSAAADPVAAATSVLPTIALFQPTSAGANSLVRITGTGFSPTLSGNIVTFATGQNANVILATPNSMVVTVPAGAQTGTVTVKTPRGSVTSAATFTVTAAAAGTQTLAITSFTPANGRPGTRVTLNGQFGTMQGNVYFTGTAPNPTQIDGYVASWTANSIQVDVPTGAQYGRITVAAGGATGTSATDFDTWQGDLSYMTNTYQASYPGAYTVPYHGSSYGWTSSPYNNFNGMSIVASTSVTASGSAPTPDVNYVYVSGGYDNTAGGSGYNVTMWPVAADGTLGTAKWVGRLNIPRSAHTSVVIGKYLFIIGGYDSQGAGTYAGMEGPRLRSIERATINSDGTLATNGLPVSGLQTSAQFTLLGYTVGTPTNGDLLMAGGRYHHRSFAGFNGGVPFIWNIGGYGTPGNLNTWETFTVNLSTGALNTSGSNRTGTLQPGPFSWLAGGAQLIGSGILLAGGYYNGGYWSYSMTLPISPVDGSLQSGTMGPQMFNCPSYTRSYGSQYGQLTFVNVNGTGRVYHNFGIQYASVGGAAETNQAVVNMANGQIPGAWSCATSGAPMNVTRNQNWNTAYNDQHVVVPNGGTYRIYQFGGYGAGYYIQHTEINDDGTLCRTHAWGQTRDNHYSAAALTLANKAWVIGGYRTSDNSSWATDTTEYYTLRDDNIVGVPTMGPKLAMARYGPMFTTSWPNGPTATGYLYIMGGFHQNAVNTMGGQDTVERATINPTTGMLGSFSTLPVRLNLRNYYGAAITIGNYVYVVGGYHPTYGALNTVERATIDSNGNLSTFEVLSNYLPYTTYSHTLKQVGNFLYLVAGQPGSIATNMVLRARVYPDGDIGTFSRMPSSDIPSGTYGAGVEVFGNYLYRCGGYNDQTNCYRAFINWEGTLQSWSVWQPMSRAILPVSSYDNVGHAMYRYKDRVYWFSGINNSWNILTAPLR